MSSVQRDEVRTFWTGPPLSYYEILSLKSFVATGARVFLYSYDADLIVPDGVELRDAREILSDSIDEFRNANGDISLSRHSDTFRYAMLQQHGGWYADLDIICLKNELPKADTYFVTAQEGKWLNTAVLKIPRHSELIETLLCEARRVIPETGGQNSELARIAIGPALFNRTIHQFEMDHLASPKRNAYEIGFDELLFFFDPARCESVQARLAASDFTHLWNEGWKAIRLPKNYGPPKGSYLDLMFRRFGIDVPERGRLQYDAIVSWVMEERFLTDVKNRIGVERITSETIDDFGEIARPRGKRSQADTGSTLKLHSQSSIPQTVRSFWHGDFISPYQLLCLKSFADRGHDVEVFSYDAKLAAPSWLKIRDATEILPRELVLYPLPQPGQFAVHADLFRYALLEKLGGWWLDSGLMLLKPDLPDGEVYFAEPDVFGLIPTAILKFPPRHPVIQEARKEAEALGGAYDTWARAGSQLLTPLLTRHDPQRRLSGRESLGPITWFDVPDLFDPLKTAELSENCADSRFLHFHNEVWRRAGVPLWLGPPKGAYLDSLFARHQLGLSVFNRLTFGELNRWIKHMYMAAEIGRVKA